MVIIFWILEIGAGASSHLLLLIYGLNIVVFKERIRSVLSK